jgi:enamine deaminase RidA (YjgF/YER057c/UK114 family)
MKSTKYEEDSQLLLPDGWGRPSGYSEGVSARGRLLFTAGQVGWNPITKEFESNELVSQVEQALRNIVSVLKEGGAFPRHLVRLTWFITSKAEYIAARGAIGSAYFQIIGKHYPPMTIVVVSDLLEECAKVEIEGMAIIPDRSV